MRAPRFDAVRVSTESDSLLDQVLSSSVKGYERDFSAERVEWIADAAALHVEQCAQYARLAAASGFKPHQVRNTEDLEGIPLIPSSLFKRQAVLSRVCGEVIECRSSGTQGTQSVIHRDQPTMERFVAGMLHGAKEFYERHEVRQAFVLGPPTEEAGTLWFSYVLGLLDLAFETSFFVHEDEFRPDELAASLCELQPGTQPVIVGPPPLVSDFCCWVASDGIALNLSGCQGMVVTAGGWKVRDAERIERDELTALVTETLGVVPELVRDFFNMVELNTVLFECEHRQKHVPPWVEVIARRPYDMRRADPGEEGVLTYLDPTAGSYPCFIFSDDIGRVLPGPCKCGRVGATIALSRRLNKIEERGCALKMQRYAKGRGE
jgi:long-chain-fatty-acid---luciferin-component ligase